MPLSSKDQPKGTPMAEKSTEKPTAADRTADSPSADAPSGAEQGIMNPHQTTDPNHPDLYGDLDPTKVVGTYAMQPDPNDERPAPLPNVPPGVNVAPADDEPGAPAIGDGSNTGS